MPAPNPATAAGDGPVPGADFAEGPDAPGVPRRRVLEAVWAAAWPCLFLSAKPLSVREQTAVAAPETAAVPDAAAAPADRLPPPLAGLGVSLAGAEFGVERPAFSAGEPGAHGADFLHPTPGGVLDVAAAGVRLVRLPVRWERLQPVPGGPLDADELARVRLTLDRLAAAGCGVILDLHNYARFVPAPPAGEAPRAVLIDEVVRTGGRRAVPVSRHHLAEFWATVAGAFAGHPAVAGWGLMNEPHDLAPAGAVFDGGDRCDWPAVGRAAVAAVRGVDPHTPVVVAGADWSSSERWAAANGPDPWVDDPHVVYEAHCYVDADGSGKYRATFADERAADPRVLSRGARRVAPFLEWCARTGSRGFLGEFGVPNPFDSADDGWLRVLRPLLRELAGADTPGCLWAAGEWWGEYPLNHHPAGGAAGPVLAEVLGHDPEHDARPGRPAGST